MSYFYDVLDVHLTGEQLDIIIDVLDDYEGPDPCAHDVWDALVETLKRQRDVLETPPPVAPAWLAAPPTIDPEIARIMETL